MDIFDRFHTIGKAFLLLMLIAVELTTTGCSVFSSRQAVIKEPAAKPVVAKASDKRLEVVGVALAQLGTPYVYGGATPQKGFDCSGLVQYSHNNAGIWVPRTAAEQFSHSARKDVAALLPGDLLFFRTPKSNHVGIYLGGGEFIHAPSRGKNVRLSSIHRPYWRRYFTGAGSYL